MGNDAWALQGVVLLAGDHASCSFTWVWADLGLVFWPAWVRRTHYLMAALGSQAGPTAGTEHRHHTAGLALQAESPAGAASSTVVYLVSGALAAGGSLQVALPLGSPQLPPARLQHSQHYWVANKGSPF